MSLLLFGVQLCGGVAPYFFTHINIFASNFFVGL